MLHQGIEMLANENTIGTENKENNPFLSNIDYNSLTPSTLTQSSVSHSNTILIEKMKNYPILQNINNFNPDIWNIEEEKDEITNFVEFALSIYNVATDVLMSPNKEISKLKQKKIILELFLIAEECQIVNILLPLANKICSNGNVFYTLNEETNIWESSTNISICRTIVVENFLIFLGNLMNIYNNWNYDNKNKSTIYTTITKLRTMISKIDKATSITKALTKRIDRKNMEPYFKDGFIMFDNGFYSLDNRNVTKYEANDNVTVTIGRDYIPLTNVDIARKFFSEIIPEQSQRVWFVRKIYECFDTRITNSDIIFIVGKGGNGKSVLLNIILKLFGNFGTSTNANIFTCFENKSSAPNPELTKLNNKYFCGISEFEGNIENMGIFKNLTGGDVISVRNLYENPKSFKAVCKFFIFCNKLPNFSFMDEAVWRRVKIIELTNVFREMPNENEKLANKSYEFQLFKIPNFIELVTNYVFDVGYDDVEMPEDLKKLQKRFRVETDNLISFLENNVIQSNNNILTTTEICIDFLETDNERIVKSFLMKNKKKIVSWFNSTYNVNIARHQKMEDNKIKKMFGWKGFALI